MDSNFHFMIMMIQFAFTEVLLTKITPLKELVEVVEVGGEAMEE